MESYGEDSRCLAGLAVERRKALRRKRGLAGQGQVCDMPEVEVGGHLKSAANQGYVVRPYLKTTNQPQYRDIGLSRRRARLGGVGSAEDHRHANNISCYRECLQAPPAPG